MTERILNDRYALESKVGEGGMAVTYRARDLLLNRTVAVKLMREQFTADAQFVERFRREAQALARLSHENIAGVYDTGRADGAYYIVMEFIEGTDLKQRLRREGPLPVLNALEISRQISAALDAAHRSGIVHRDIKPHNILLNAEGKVKVTDFGIAKIASDGEDTGMIIGSVHYLSPEQARGEVTTPSSDIYALGCVLYEMLTGRTVFEAENAMAVAHMQACDPPAPPRTHRPQLSPAIEALVLKCLNKHPEARYHSAAELQAVLTQLIGQLSQEDTIVTAIPTPSMDATMIYRQPVNAAHEQPQRPVRQPAPPPEPEPSGNRGGLWIGILLMLLAAVITYGGFQFIRPGTPPPPPPGIEIVPDLTGLTKEQAVDLLQKHNFTFEDDTERSNDVEKGQVARQDPQKDSRVDPTKTTVFFWLSKGRVSFQMPEVASMSFDAARREIRNQGYEADFTVQKEPNELPKGTVIRTTPATGTTVTYNGKVVLVLSRGIDKKEETYHPGNAPDLDAPTTFVRIELQRPGKDPEEMYSDTLKPGDAIPDQHFERQSSEKVIVRMYAGKDEAGIGNEPYAEETFGPSVDNAPPAPTGH
ncbi:MAG: Stk1 family PASTA domain-containing Ser/Thr kinase [Armatimonadota bacterium]